MVLTVLILSPDNRGVGGVCVQVTFDQLLIRCHHTSMATLPSKSVPSVVLQAFYEVSFGWVHFLKVESSAH